MRHVNASHRFTPFYILTLNEHENSKINVLMPIPKKVNRAKFKKINKVLSIFSHSAVLNILSVMPTLTSEIA